MAKNVIERKLKKQITPLMEIVFIITLVIGFAVGFGIHYLLPKPDYKFTLNGSEVVQLHDAAQYEEKGITVVINGNVLGSEYVIIEGRVENEIGIYIIKYTIKDIRGLETLALKRVVIIKGENVINEPTEANTPTDEISNQGGIN